MAQGDLWTKYDSRFQLKKVSVKVMDMRELLLSMNLLGNEGKVKEEKVVKSDVVRTTKTPPAPNNPNMTNCTVSEWPRLVLVDIKEQIGCLNAVKVRFDAAIGKMKVFCDCKTCKLREPNVKSIYISCDLTSKHVSKVKSRKKKQAVSKWIEDCASQSIVIKPKKTNYRRIESDDDELEEILLYPPGESDGEISDIDITDEEKLLQNLPVLEDASVPPECSKSDVKAVVAVREKSLETDRVVEECQSNSETVLVTINNDKCKDGVKTSKSRHSSKNGTDGKHRDKHNSDVKKDGKVSENRKTHRQSNDIEKRRLDFGKSAVQSKVVARQPLQPEIRNSASTPALIIGTGDLRNTLNSFRIPKKKLSGDRCEPDVAAQKAETFGGDVKSRLGRKLSDAEFDSILSRQSSSGSSDNHEPAVSSMMTSAKVISGETSTTNEQYIFSEAELNYWNQIEEDWTDEDANIEPANHCKSDWPPYFPLTTDAHLRPRVKAKRAVPMAIVDQSEVQDINDPGWELTRQQLSHWESHRQVWGNQPCPDPRRNLSSMNFKFRKLGLNWNSFMSMLDDCNDPASDIGQSVIFSREVFRKKETSLSEYFDMVVEDENRHFNQEKERISGVDSSGMKLTELSTRHEKKLHELNLYRAYCLKRLSLAHDEIVDFQTKSRSLGGNEYFSSDLILNEKEVDEIKDVDRIFNVFGEYYVSK